MMRRLVLMYHDIVPPSDEDGSGFHGAAPARYKLDPGRFRKHLDLIDHIAGHRATAAGRPLRGRLGLPIWLTFDDGGVSAISVVADELERRDWRGHFFIATDHIGSAGFLSPSHIEELHRRGHVIGSHMRSHPSGHGGRSWNELVDDWSQSIHVLEDIIGCAVTLGSAPGGLIPPVLLSAAHHAGLRALLTSEQTTGEATSAEGLTCIGRFAVRRSTRPEQLEARLRDRTWAKTTGQAWWQIKRLGRLYRARQHALTTTA